MNTCTVPVRPAPQSRQALEERQAFEQARLRLKEAEESERLDALRRETRAAAAGGPSGSVGGPSSVFGSPLKPIGPAPLGLGLSPAMGSSTARARPVVTVVPRSSPKAPTSPLQIGLLAEHADRRTRSPSSAPGGLGLGLGQDGSGTSPPGPGHVHALTRFSPSPGAPLAPPLAVVALHTHTIMSPETPSKELGRGPGAKGRGTATATVVGPVDGKELEVQAQVEGSTELSRGRAVEEGSQGVAGGRYGPDTGHGTVGRAVKRLRMSTEEAAIRIGLPGDGQRHGQEAQLEGGGLVPYSDSDSE